MSLLVQVAAAPATMPTDNRLLFAVTVGVVVSVVVFTAGVITTLLRRSDRRRAEEEKLAAMGTATARILHQIKNPLQTIVLHSDLLQNEKMVADPLQRRDVADAIISESQRLVDMVAELSVYASGAQRALNRQPLFVDDLARQVTANEAREAEESGVRVDATGVERAMVFADAYFLRQVLDNLVRNAREAMTDAMAAGRMSGREARLSVSVERDGGQAVVRVADNGPGIPADKLDLIFQPFWSTKGKGMGLGLAICRELVEGHAGRLEVESTVDVGTTFTVRLPLYGDGVGADTLPGLAPEPVVGAAWT
ncbi:MAG TPA: HAMP domain-containing sensor histidine kinase [Longimicrobium sp.]|jgi:signal transduction histidine kinase|uniref:sensor histidine kinase n=1 Tax=Longimicrobium sp. TaxID=2029185 RepID=UPI002EDB73D7